MLDNLPSPCRVRVSIFQNQRSAFGECKRLLSLQAHSQRANPHHRSANIEMAAPTISLGTPVVRMGTPTVVMQQPQVSVGAPQVNMQAPRIVFNGGAHVTTDAATVRVAVRYYVWYQQAWSISFSFIASRAWCVPCAFCPHPCRE